MVFLITLSDFAYFLRQGSPFAGVLEPRERWEILRRLSADNDEAVSR
jgi:hypothetical protein